MGNMFWEDKEKPPKFQSKRLEKNQWTVSNLRIYLQEINPSQLKCNTPFFDIQAVFLPEKHSKITYTAFQNGTSHCGKKRS